MRYLEDDALGPKQLLGIRIYPFIYYHLDMLYIARCLNDSNLANHHEKVQFIFGFVMGLKDRGTRIVI
jgi:hypothetical protein